MPYPPLHISPHLPRQAKKVPVGSLAGPPGRGVCHTPLPTHSSSPPNLPPAGPKSAFEIASGTPREGGMPYSPLHLPSPSLAGQKGGCGSRYHKRSCAMKIANLAYRRGGGVAFGIICGTLGEGVWHTPLPTIPPASQKGAYGVACGTPGEGSMAYPAPHTALLTPPSPQQNKKVLWGSLVEPHREEGMAYSPPHHLQDPRGVCHTPLSSFPPGASGWLGVGDLHCSVCMRQGTRATCLGNLA